MRKAAWFSLLLGLSGMLNPSYTFAISLEFQPASITTAGQPVMVEVVISGLGDFTPPSVGAFDLDVSFDPALLSPTDVTFGPFLGDPAFLEALTDFQFFPGVVDLAEVSLLLTVELDALQPESFTLATLTFNPLGVGTSPLIFFQVIVDDPFGGKLDIVPGEGSVTITPEPSTLLLLGSGVMGLALWRRRK
jgi:hypothetical protein